MKVLANKLLVERIKRPVYPGSVIVLPPILLDDNNTGGPKEFLVLQTGPGRRTRKGVVLPIECEPGDRVICHSYTTGAVEVGNGKMIITDDQIIAVLPK